MLKRLTHTVLFAAIFTIFADHTALAQSDGKFAIGANFGMKQPTDDEAEGTVGPSLLWRIGHGHEGWKYKYGLNWYSSQLQRTIGESQMAIGKLKVRPIMVGYGYTHVMGPSGRVKVSANLLGGYAFTKFGVDRNARTAMQVLTGSDAIDTDVKNTFVIKPEISTWIDLNHKIGLNLNVGYMLARPVLTVKTPLGEEHGRARLDQIMFKIGIAYSVF